jgi:hypothetical protein
MYFISGSIMKLRPININIDYYLMESNAVEPGKLHRRFDGTYGLHLHGPRHANSQQEAGGFVCLMLPFTANTVKTSNPTTKKLNSVALVRKRTIPTERPSLVGELSANFCG